MQTLTLSVYFSQVDARSTKNFLIKTEDNPVGWIGNMVQWYNNGTIVGTCVDHADCDDKCYKEAEKR